MMNISEEIASVTGMLEDKIVNWAETLINHIPNFVLAVIVVLLFALIAKTVKKYTIKLLSNYEIGTSLVNLIGSIISIVIITGGVFIALGVLNLEKTVTSLLAGAGIIGLALGFAFQDLTANFLSGVFIAIKQPIRIGDVVETNDYFGKVKKIGLRSTIIDNFAGQEIEIPSKDIFQNPIKNYSKTGERRMELQCGIGYDENLRDAQKVARQAIEGLDFLQKNKEVQVLFEEFGGSSINFKIWFWIDQKKAGPPLAFSEAVIALKEAFDEADINIPFPIRTLELKNQKEVLAPFISDYQNN